MGYEIFKNLIGLHELNYKEWKNFILNKLIKNLFIILNNTFCLKSEKYIKSKNEFIFFLEQINVCENSKKLFNLNDFNFITFRKEKANIFYKIIKSLTFF